MRAYKHACIYGYNIFYILTQSEEKLKHHWKFLISFILTRQLHESSKESILNGNLKLINI